MSSKQAGRNGEDQLYYVQITEPSSGILRVFYLFDGITEDELFDLFKASFQKHEYAKGFSDESGVIYPPSMLALKPKLFGGRKLFVINDHRDENSSHLLSQHQGTVLPSIGKNSQDSLLTEEQVRNAFDILDMNNDNVIHKEEFITVMNLAYSNLFDLDPAIAFAYQCINSKDLAIITAMFCYHNHHFIREGSEQGEYGNTLTNGKKRSTSSSHYYLTYDDFAAWYLSIGFDPLRELMIKAIELFSSYHDTSDEEDEEEDQKQKNNHLKRTKSRISLDLATCYQDIKLNSFINHMKSSFVLDINTIIKLSTAFHYSGKYSTFINKQKCAIILFHSLNNSFDINDENDQATISSYCNILFSILDLQNKNQENKTETETETISLASLFSLFVFCFEESD
jgi:hypothetical protein